MMKIKRVLCPGRLRQLPVHWSWVDHRLVREGYLERCDLAALGLYLFLVCVADAQGLSYYSDLSIGRHLKLEPVQLQGARQQLQNIGLIAYEKPIYQVLELNGKGWPLSTVRPSGSSVEAKPMGEVIARILGGGGA